MNERAMPDPDITFIDPINSIEKGIGLDFPALVTLIKGSSIKSMAISEKFFELGLSDAFNLRMQINDGSLEIFLVSTLNKGEPSPIRFQIVEEGEKPASAYIVAKRINSLRQLYATAFLLDAGRAEDIARALSENLNVDLETTFLKEEDYLFITAASEGSFWITLLVKTGAAAKTLAGIVPLFYDQGRQALLERVRATTDLRKLDVDQREMDINFQKANKIIELIQKIEKIKDPDVRERVQEVISSNMTTLGKPLLLLPKPDEGKKK
jgi:hypothetical protein